MACELHACINVVSRKCYRRKQVKTLMVLSVAIALVNILTVMLNTL